MEKLSDTQKGAEKEQQKKQKKMFYVYKPATSANTPASRTAQPPMESHDSIGTNLKIGPSKSTIKTIMFTGTTQYCGVSRTTISYATSLAIDSSHKVLLVDANLRAPHLHEVFNIGPYTGGLTNLLNDETDICTHIKKAVPNNLSVLVCGQKASRPTALFESSNFDNFLNTIRRQFDYVILDVPPAPVFPESRIIASKVDGVVLVVVSGKTRRHVALRAKTELERSGANLIGVVLNRRKYYIPEWIYQRL